MSGQLLLSQAMWMDATSFLMDWKDAGISVNYDLPLSPREKLGLLRNVGVQ